MMATRRSALHTGSPSTSASNEDRNAYGYSVRRDALRLAQHIVSSAQTWPDAGRISRLAD
jgi:hypothetical protein